MQRNSKWVCISTTTLALNAYTKKNLIRRKNSSSYFIFLRKLYEAIVHTME